MIHGTQSKPELRGLTWVDPDIFCDIFLIFFSPRRASGHLALEHPVGGEADRVEDEEGGGGAGADPDPLQRVDGDG